MATTREDILAFARRQVLAVEASVTDAGAPQAAVIGVVVSDAFEVFFDTLSSSRKYANLTRDARVALVLGWDLDEGCTVQLEGVVDAPEGADLDRLQRLYFERFPDGVARQRSPDIVYFRVRPAWIRFSDFRGSEPLIAELTAAELGDPGGTRARPVSE